MIYEEFMYDYIEHSGRYWNEILDYVVISSVENEVHVHEWMQLFISSALVTYFING